MSENFPMPKDPAQVFLTYIQFGGNIEQTAMVLQLEVCTIEALSAAGQWPKKIAEIKKLADGKDAKEYGLSVNRGINLIQADRLRRLVDRVLSALTSKSDEEIMDILTTTGPKGSSFSTRPLTDLVKAAAEAQLMTRLALGDVGAGELGDDTGKGSDIAMSVMKAMQAAGELEVDLAPMIKDL